MNLAKKLLLSKLSDKELSRYVHEFATSEDIRKFGTTILNLPNCKEETWKVLRSTLYSGTIQALIDTQRRIDPTVPWIKFFKEKLGF